MNPKISITVDAKNKAVASLTGMVTVGSKCDIEVVGIALSDVPDWGSDDDFTGPSLRFRVVDALGRDLVRYQLNKKTSTSPDVWTKDTVNGKFTATDVDFDTDVLRKAFYGIPYNEMLEFGVILDSYVDKAQYAVGKMKIRQWALASTEDPTVLPDWREIVSKITVDMEAIESAKTTAVNAATSAASSATSANSNRLLAQQAKIGAEAAALTYPKIGTNDNWWVWSVTDGAWVDTGVLAKAGHNIFQGKTFARPSTARGWYELLCYMITEMGGNIQSEGITPGSEPTSITMKAQDGVSKSIVVVKDSSGNYTTEVV